MTGPDVGTWLVGHRGAVAAALGALTAGAGVGLTRLPYADVPRKFFRSDDADYARLERRPISST